MTVELKVSRMEPCLVASWGDQTARRLGDLKVDLTAAMMVGGDHTSSDEAYAVGQ